MLPKPTYILLSIALVLLISCHEDFLEKNPPGVYSENYFYNEKGIDVVFSEEDKFQPIPQAQLDLQPDVLVQRPGYL